MTDHAGLRAQLDEYAEKFAAVDGYASLVRVLRAAASALDPGWQPIETAPKDGQWLIGASFNADGHFVYEPRRMSWGTTQHATGAWCTTTGWFVPTHWMPLPAPPLAGAREPER